MSVANLAFNVVEGNIRRRVQKRKCMERMLGSTIMEDDDVVVIPDDDVRWSEGDQRVLNHLISITLIPSTIAFGSIALDLDTPIFSPNPSIGGDFGVLRLVCLLVRSYELIRRVM